MPPPDPNPYRAAGTLAVPAAMGPLVELVRLRADPWELQLELVYRVAARDESFQRDVVLREVGLPLGMALVEAAYQTHDDRLTVHVSYAQWEQGSAAALRDRVIVTACGLALAVSLIPLVTWAAPRSGPDLATALLFVGLGLLALFFASRRLPGALHRRAVAREVTRALRTHATKQLLPRPSAARLS